MMIGGLAGVSVEPAVGHKVASRAAGTEIALDRAHWNATPHNSERH
jgi:hypothetical protein